MRRLRTVAILFVLLTAACSGGADNGNDAPTSPTKQLAAPQDVEAAGAKRLSDMGAADWLVVAAGVGLGLRPGRWQAGRPAPRSNRQAPQHRHGPGAGLHGMDVGYGSVWAATCAPATVTRINAKTGKVQARIPIDTGVLAHESSLAAGEGGVWVLNLGPQLIKIDPRSNKVVRTTAAPEGSTAVRAGLGGLWVTAAETGKLHRLDPDDLSVVATVEVGQGANFLAIGEQAVWVLVDDTGSAVRVDPRSNKVVATIKVSVGPIGGGDIAIGGGSVWARAVDPLAARIDPATNEVTARYGPVSGSGGVAADDTGAWFAAHDVQTVWRLPLS
jgi:hypothetical protein